MLLRLCILVHLHTWVAQFPVISMVEINLNSEKDKSIEHTLESQVEVCPNSHFFNYRVV